MCGLPFFTQLAASIVAKSQTIIPVTRILNQTANVICLFVMIIGLELTEYVGVTLHRLLRDLTQDDVL